MSKYDDVFIRDDLNDVGNMPNSFYGSLCPDIISRVESVPADQVQAKFGVGTYNDGTLGQNIEEGQYNYIYVRAKNLGTETATGVIFNLYYAPGSTFNSPSIWRNNLAGSVTFDPIPAGQVFAAPEPVIWLPLKDPNHYCLIGQIVTARHPNPIPPNRESEDFKSWYNWASHNPADAYRNVNVVNNIPDIGAQWKKILSNPTDNQRFFGIRVVCTNCPENSLVKIYCANPEAQPPVNVSQYIHPDKTTHKAYVPAATTLKAGFSDEYIVSFQPPLKPGPDATVVIQQWSSLSPDEADFLPHTVSEEVLMLGADPHSNAATWVPTGEFTLDLKIS